MKSLFLQPKPERELIGLWCNGSTTDFDSVCLGSKPGNPTTKSSAFAEDFAFMEELVEMI